MHLNVNTDAAIQLTARLEKISRSAFPLAVRNSLNDAAFDMKKKDILDSAKKNFPGLKAQTFFKKYTGVRKASGFSVNSMVAVFGFLNASDPSVRKAIEGMETQEFGGIIDDGLRYLKFSRGNRIKGFVQKRNYYDPTKVITGRNRGGKGTRKSKFVARAARAHQENKPFFMNTMKGNFLVTVKSMTFDRENDKVDIKLNFLMMDRKMKVAKIKRTNFNKEAALKAVNRMDEYYTTNAEKQFKKHLRL